MIVFPDPEWFDTLEQLGKTPSGKRLARFSDGNGQTTYLTEEFHETIGLVHQVIYDSKHNTGDILHCIAMDSKRLYDVSKQLSVRNKRVEEIHKEKTDV